MKFDMQKLLCAALLLVLSPLLLAAQSAGEKKQGGTGRQELTDFVGGDVSAHMGPQHTPDLSVGIVRDRENLRELTDNRTPQMACSPSMDLNISTDARSRQPRRLGARTTINREDIIAHYDGYNVGLYASHSPKVSRWIDISGHGNDMYVNASAHMPDQLELVDGNCLEFNGVRYLNLPTGMDLRSNNFTFYMVAQFRRVPKANSNQVVISLNGDSNKLTYHAIQESQSNRLAVKGAPSLVRTQNALAPYWFSSSDLSVKTGSGAKEDSVPPVRPRFGLNNGGYFSHSAKGMVANVYEVIICNQKHTDAEVDQVLSYFEEKYRCLNRKDTDLCIVAEGDSLTNGGSAPNYGYTEQLMRMFPTQPMFVRVSAAGRQTDNMLASVGSRVISEFAFRAEYKKRIAVFWAGSNDLNAGRNVADIIADHDSWASAVLSSGAIVVALTVLPRNDITPQQEADRRALNTAIRSNVNGVHAVVDVAAIPELQDPNDPVVFVDGVHLTEYGYYLVASHVKEAIDNLDK